MDRDYQEWGLKIGYQGNIYNFSSFKLILQSIDVRLERVIPLNNSSTHVLRYLRVFYLSKSRLTLGSRHLNEALRKTPQASRLKRERFVIVRVMLRRLDNVNFALKL